MYLANFSIISEIFFFVQRTLFVIEALLRSDVPDVYSHLDLCLEELETLTSSEHSSVKAKATKVSRTNVTFSYLLINSGIFFTHKTNNYFACSNRDYT